MYDELVEALHLCVKYDNAMDALMNAEKAADAIEELSRDLDSMNEANIALYGALPKWIPVTERLPEQGKRYLVIQFDEVTKTQFIDILWHDAHDLWWNRLYKGQYNVTHWMQLPQLPKEE